MSEPNPTRYSQRTAMLAIARASFRSITRSPSAVVFSLVFPMIFIVVFGFIGGSRFNIRMGLTSGSHKDNPLYRGLSEMKTVQWVESGDSAQADALSRGRLDAVLQIRPSAGITTSYHVTLKTSTASPEGGRLAALVLENIVQKLNISEAHLRNSAVTLIEQQVQGRRFKTIDFILPGQLGFSLLSTGVFGTAFGFFHLRQTLVLKRFFATPIRRPFIILGEALARMAFAMLGAIVIIGIGYFAFGFTLIHGLPTLLGMLLISALGLIVFMGFGFIVSGVARNDSAIPPLANLITLPQFLLSGTFFSIEVFPPWLQPVCRVLPLTYLNDAMRKVAFEGAGPAAISTQLLILTGWGLLAYAVAVKTFRWE